MDIRRKPAWLQKRVAPGAHAEMDQLLGGLKLNTVCREAMCPNITECFQNKQATLLIMGAICTRQCRFCNVTKEQPQPLDLAEPERVAEAVARLGLRHVVITSPTRDDLADGGASHYAATVAAIRGAAPATRIELLVPDFQGDHQSLSTVLTAAPDILSHNLETVPRLYTIRAGADYRRSLDLLLAAHELVPAIPTKSGLMLGLGETEAEVLAVLDDLRSVGCSYLSLGQYLSPSRQHQPVVVYIPPEQFAALKEQALALGFAHVESGPYVRSSYLAEQYGSKGT